MSNPAVEIISAINFAAKKHSGQLRKDAAQSPYINHPIAVVAVLALEGKVADSELLIAAALHDVLEDTDCEKAELVDAFGTTVADLVAEVTDDKKLEKSRRKHLQVENAIRLSNNGKQLRIADKITNIRDVDCHSPVRWDVQRKQDYLEWAASVARHCKGVNTLLDQLFDLELSKAQLRIATEK